MKATSRGLRADNGACRGGFQTRPRGAYGLDRGRAYFSGGYFCAGIDRPRRHVPSRQYSPAVISPARGNITVNGSAVQRTKNSKKLSVGGPESGPLLFHSIHVSGRYTAAPSASPNRQTLKVVIGRHKETRDRQGRKRKMV